MPDAEIVRHDRANPTAPTAEARRVHAAASPARCDHPSRSCSTAGLDKVGGRAAARAGGCTACIEASTRSAIGVRPRGTLAGSGPCLRAPGRSSSHGSAAALCGVCCDRLEGPIDVSVRRRTAAGGADPAFACIRCASLGDRAALGTAIVTRREGIPVTHPGPHDRGSAAVRRAPPGPARAAPGGAGSALPLGDGLRDRPDAQRPRARLPAPLSTHGLPTPEVNARIGR